MTSEEKNELESIEILLHSPNQNIVESNELNEETRNTKSFQMSDGNDVVEYDNNKNLVVYESNDNDKSINSNWSEVIQNSTNLKQKKLELNDNNSSFSQYSDHENSYYDDNYNNNYNNHNLNIDEYDSKYDYTLSESPTPRLMISTTPPSSEVLKNEEILFI